MFLMNEHYFKHTSQISHVLPYKYSKAFPKQGGQSQIDTWSALFKAKCHSLPVNVFFFYKFLFRLDKNIQFQQTNVRFPETSLLGVNSFASLTLSEFVCM